MTDHLDMDQSQLAALVEAGAFRPLKGAAVLTYIVLVGRMGIDRPWAPMSLERLAYYTGLAKGTVCVAVRQLADAKLIEHRPGAGGAQSAFRVVRSSDSLLTHAA